MTDKWKKILKITGYSVAGVVAFIVVFSVIVSLVVRTNWAQGKLKALILPELQKTLKTNVEIDRIGISLWSQSMQAYGLAVDDLAGEKLLKADEVSASLSFWRLLTGTLEVKSASCEGVDANLYKVRADSAANFQFLVDALKPKNDNKPKKINVNINKVILEDFSVRYQVRDSSHLKVSALLEYGKIYVKDTTAYVDGLKLSYNNLSLKIDELDVDYPKRQVVLEDVESGNDAKKLQVETLTLTTGPNPLDSCRLQIEELSFKTDNGKPRRNDENPNRGAFDAGHLNLVANADVKFNHLAADSLSCEVQHLDLKDEEAGLDINQVTFSIATNMRTAMVSNLSVVSHSTVVKIPSLQVNLPVGGQPFSFGGARVSAKTVLEDISEPFAPALDKFTTPLVLTTDFSGDDNRLQFSNVKISTTDKSLTIAAAGEISDINKARSGGKPVHLMFSVDSMRATDAAKDLIISHFVNVKQSLQGLLDAAGAVGYKGTVEVGHQFQAFKGKVSTEIGDVDADFRLDSKTKYMEGTATISNFHVGKLVKMKDLGTVALDATFKVDIAGRIAAAKMGRYHGKVPICNIEGHVKEVKYTVGKNVLNFAEGTELTFNDVDYTLASEGHRASGTIEMKRSHFDMAVDFSFSDTNFSKGDFKFKPRVRLHDLNPFKKAKNS